MTIPDLQERLKRLRQKTFSYLTAEQAKEYGFELDPGWAVRTNFEGDEPKYTYVSPDKWEFSEFVYDDLDKLSDYLAVSPEGKRYTKAELETFQTPTIESSAERQYATLDQFNILKRRKQAGTLGKQFLTTELWLTARQAKELGYNRGEEDFLLSPLEPEAETRVGRIPAPTIETVIGRLYPDKTIESLNADIQTNREAFLTDLQTKGKSEDSIALLTALGADRTMIDGFFAGQPEVSQIIPEAVPSSFLTDYLMKREVGQLFDIPKWRLDPQAKEKYLSEQIEPGLKAWLDRNLVEPLAELEREKGVDPTASLARLLGGAVSFLPDSKSFQDMSTSEKVESLGFSILASIPWSRATLGIVKDVGKQTASRAFEKALNAGLDKWIATQGRLIPESRSVLGNWLVKDRTWLIEKASNNLMARMAERRAAKLGIDKMVQEAVEDTIDDIGSRLLTSPDVPPEVKAVITPTKPVTAAPTPTTERVTPIPEKITPAPEVKEKLGFREWQRKYGKNISDELDEKAWRKYYFKQPTIPKAVPEKVTPAPEVTKQDFIIKPEKEAGIGTVYRVYDKSGNKQLIDFRSREQAEQAIETSLKARQVAIPKAEAAQTWTEAGIQPSMLPEEVAAIEVRPPAKGKITQISMDDQLKLEQAKKAAEEAPAETQEAYQAQWEIEALATVHQIDPVANFRFKMGNRNVGLDSLISIRDQNFPEHLSVKQAQALRPEQDWSRYAQKGLPTYNKVPTDSVLDTMTSELGFTGTSAVEDLGKRVMAIRRERQRIKALESDIEATFTEKPLDMAPELTTEQIVESQDLAIRPLTPAQRAKALELFGKYVTSESTLDAWGLTRELRREALSLKAESLKARTQELIIEKGIPAEEGMKQAIQETLSGELPVIRTDYLSDLTNEMRDVFFAEVAIKMKDYPFEMASTYTALTNALAGKAIPREKGTGSILFPKGGSAWDRLNYVFGEQPEVLKSLEKMASENKPLKDVVEGIFHETGRAPIPIDEAAAEYLRNLPTKPFGQAKLGEVFIPTKVSGIRTKEQIAQETMALRIELAKPPTPPTPPPSFELPISDAFKQPLLTTLNLSEKQTIVRVLKELGMLPIDLGNLVRANLASFDFSFWRQVKTITPAHPVAFYRANIEAWKSMLSQKSAEANWQRITRDPIYQIYENVAAKGKDFLRPLNLPKGTAQWKGVEEYGYLTGERLLPRLTAKIPWVKISARSFVSGTNTMTWEVFKSHYKAMLRYSEKIASGEIKLPAGEAFDMVKEMTDMAGMIADFTQRASLGRGAPLAPALSSMFFAPRSKLGRILTPRHLLSANPRVRAEAWKDLSLFVAVIGGLVMLGKWLDLWDVELDPRSGEWGSLRIGNLRIDPWAGHRQIAVFYARIIADLFGKKGGVSSVTGAEYELNPIGAMNNFIRSSLAPLPGLILDFWTGKNFLGEKVDIANKKQWVERLLAFSLQNIWEAFQEGWREGVISILPSWVGEGVQTYTGDWKENFTKLGLPKYLENTAYGITEPKYDTADFWTDTSSQFKGVDPATLTKAKGFPEYIRAIVEARIINEHLATLPSEKLVSLNTDSAKGTTFAQYYQMWRDRETIVASGDEEALKAFDADERTRNAEKGNMSQRQFALLNEYWSITNKKKQAEFLKQHEVEIGVQPRDEYLRTHPKENAQLAVWGQAKILTKEAYNQFKALVKELDIPDSAIPEMTLPPEKSIDNYFTYQDMKADNKEQSWEADLMLAKDPDLLKFLGLTPTKTPTASLEIKTKPEYRQIYDKIASLGDKDSPDYIADEKARAEAIKKLKTETYIDDTRRIEAIEKGTDDTPIDEKLVGAHVGYGKLIDKEGVGSSSAETMLYRVDNPDYDKWRQDVGLWGDKALKPVDQSKIPGWRIDVKYIKEDAEYDALPTTARADYLAKNDDYRKDRRRREAYQKGLTAQVENYVAYYELPVIGYRRERFLVENLDFAQAVGLKVPERVPSVQYDDIYDQFKDLFDEYEEADAQGKDRIFAENPAFQESWYRRQAYGKLYPDQFVENYVAYNLVPKKGYADARYLKAHQDFYFAAKKIEGWTSPDPKWDLIPSEQIENLFNQYNKLVTNFGREEFRRAHEDLDEWLYLTGKVSKTIKEQKRRKEMTPYERFQEDLDKIRRKLEED